MTKEDFRTEVYLICKIKIVKQTNISTFCNNINELYDKIINQQQWTALVDKSPPENGNYIVWSEKWHEDEFDVFEYKDGVWYDDNEMYLEKLGHKLPTHWMVAPGKPVIKATTTIVNEAMTDPNPPQPIQYHKIKNDLTTWCGLKSTTDINYVHHWWEYITCQECLKHHGKVG